MKICFLQKQAFPYFGVMNLSASLKAAGFATDAVIANLERDFTLPLQEINADLIAISVLTMEHKWLKSIIPRIKAILPGVPVLVGGVHAMLYPAEIMAIPGVDFVCSWEGELALPELCRALAAGKPSTDIGGIGWRDGHGFVLPGIQSHPVELGVYREDRSVYYQRYKLLRNDELKQFIASRGCPYRCSFCYSEQMSQRTAGMSARIRMKAPLHVIEEIEAVLETAPIRSIFFADDMFAADEKWLAEFVELYMQRVNIPFMCNIRADRMNANTAALLHRAGCHTVSFGVETGNEKLRTDILDKRVTDEQIMRCASVLHQHGIRVQTSNMFGLPGETLEGALQTISLNIKIGADIIFSSLFMPLPGTRLAAYCIEQGYLPETFDFANLPQSFMRKSIVNIPDRRKIENLQRVSYMVVRYPFLFGIVRFLTRTITASWLYLPWLYLGSLLRYHEERKLSWFGAFRFLWRFRHSR